MPIQARVFNGPQNRFRVDRGKSFRQERPQARACAQKSFNLAPLKFYGRLPALRPLGGLAIPLQQMTDENFEPALKSGLLPFAQIFYFLHKSRNVDLREFATTQPIRGLLGPLIEVGFVQLHACILNLAQLLLWLTVARLASLCASRLGAAAGPWPPDHLGPAPAR